MKVDLERVMLCEVEISRRIVVCARIGQRKMECVMIGCVHGARNFLFSDNYSQGNLEKLTRNGKV